MEYWLISLDHDALMLKGDQQSTANVEKCSRVVCITRSNFSSHLALMPVHVIVNKRAPKVPSRGY